MIEEAVATTDALNPGEMKQVSVNGTDVLLARVGNAYHAVYAYCSHYGAPLADGALSGERVVCPWHHACFHVTTGHQLEPPGQDGLARFDVRRDGEILYVQIPDDFEPHVVAEMAAETAPSGGQKRTFVVLGGGAAGAYAVEALREAGYDGRLVLLTADHFSPYDRPNLSKDYLAGDMERPADLVLRADDFYATHDVEVRRGVTVEDVNAARRALTLAGGEEMTYDTLILCTGGTPKRPDVPGTDLDSVHTLRDVGDSDALRKKAQNAEHVVIVGASFIGMECASSLRQLSDDVPITVVAPEAVPFASVLGEKVGRMLQALHEENGITFELNTHVAALEGDGAVERVQLEGGTALPADLVVLGVGVRPATDFLAGVEKADDGGVIVDEHLRAKLEDDPDVDSGIFAAGDIARFPDWRTGEAARIEHWRLACQHGRLAGYNAAGRATPYRSVPYFWSGQHGSNLRYVGYAADWDEVLIDGDLQEHDFIAYYVQDDAVRAAFGMGRDAEMAALEELMRRELLPPPSTLREGAPDLMALARLGEGVA